VAAGHRGICPEGIKWILVLLIEEGLTNYNYIKVAYVVTTDPSFLRMTGSESATVQALLFSMTEKRVMDRRKLYKDS
jgi:hypothetical protein